MALDFKQIQKDCPKGLRKWINYKSNHIQVLADIGIYHILECFFDSVGIYIHIEPRLF